MSDTIEVTPELLQRVGEKFQTWASSLESDEQHAIGSMMVAAYQAAQAVASEASDTSGYLAGLTVFGPSAFALFTPAPSGLQSSTGPSFASLVGIDGLRPGGAYGTYHYMRP